MQPELVRIAEAAILDSEAFKDATAEGVTDEALQRELRKDADLEYVPPATCMAVWMTGKST